MPKYKCLNSKCKMFNKIDARNSRGFYDKNLEKVVDTGLRCPSCGEDSELQLPESYSTNLRNFA